MLPSIVTGEGEGEALRPVVVESDVLHDDGDLVLLRRIVHDPSEFRQRADITADSAEHLRKTNDER